ncbi:MAG: ABC transporter substrate-binding protein, partial [Alphaproteobacteria bacterium]|nr:ABC transporter substrate-binding protein [Alphaproteobacteria bacterium]
MRCGLFSTFSIHFRSLLWLVSIMLLKPLGAQKSIPVEPDIAEAQQYDDPESARFFARILFDHPEGEADEATLRAGLAPSEWQLVTLGGSAGALQALRTGQVDALCWGEPVMTLLEQRGELRIAGEARTLKGAEGVFGGPMPGVCLHATQEFVQRHPATCLALATGVVRALRWLQTAGPRDILRTVPEPYLMGDLGLYLAAFERVRESYSTDGLISAEGGRTALRA